MSPLPPSKERQHTCFLISLFSALVTSFAAFTYFMLLPLSQFSTQSTARQSIVSTLHELKKTSKVFEFTESDKYKNLSHEYDHLWDDELLPPNGGFVHLSQETNNSDRFGISMFHQLHCLAMIRTEMQYLHNIIRVLKDDGDKAHLHRRHEHGAVLSPLDHDREHPMHCFDYLRQSLLCLADATIERPKLYDNGDPFIDGMGERICRNWELLYKASKKSDRVGVRPDDLR